MDSDGSEIEPLVESIHEEVPITFKVSLTMSKHTRDLLAEIRDAINEETLTDT
ncbi:MAG: hypothetical protein ABEJ60_01530 [Halodesulfurarchaeum sp.]